MKCKEIEKYLPFYPGEVDPDIKQAIDLHLSHCEKCQAMYDSLKLYRTYAKTTPNIDAPVNFENNVMEALENAWKISRQKNFFRMTLFVTTSAAAILILFLIFRSTVPPWENARDTSFMINLEKTGKGPSPEINFEKIDNSLSNILEESRAQIEKKERNTITGYYDYIIVAVAAEHLDVFINKYNSTSINPIPHPGTNRKNKAVSYYKIYFDVIQFSAADIDGNNRADLVLQFLSGRYKGHWMTWLNKDSSRFTETHFLRMEKDESVYLGDNTLACGDFNGDGLDDICIYASNDASRFSDHILINKKDYIFSELDQNTKNQIMPGTSKGTFVNLLSGDINRNGKDELIRISAIDEIHYAFSFPNNSMEYQVLNMPDILTSNGAIMAGDMNGDQYADICVKYLDGQRGGQTHIFENLKTAFSTEPFDMGLSFFGDYIFSIADYNGDGFDDLFVKSGGPFLPGSWYIMKNTGTGKFTFELEFELSFPLE